MRIICYGDSNTFGYIPGRGGRYNRHTRWPGVLQDLLGSSYEVIEEGLCGRTTVFEDRTEPGRCGLDRITKAVTEHGPADLLILMLGSNDCKTQFQASPEQITKGMEQIAEKARACAGRDIPILLIAPAAMTEQVMKSGFGSEFDLQSVKVSQELADTFEKLAARCGCHFLDGSKAAKVSETDGLHLDEKGHQKLAEAVKSKVIDLTETQKM